MKAYLLVGIFSVAACGGEGNKHTKDRPLHETGTPPPPTTCSAASSYAAADINGERAFTYMTAFIAGAFLNHDAKPDGLQIELDQGGAAFGGGDVVPGTYALTGPELNYETCSVCVAISTDIDEANGTQADLYMATGGTVEVIEVSPSLVVTLTNATFEHVTLGEANHTTPVGDGCVSSIASASISATLDGGAPPSGTPAPDGWTCDPGYYGAGDGCDCGCGVADLDCEDRPNCVEAGCDAQGLACDYCVYGAINCGGGEPPSCASNDECGGGFCVDNVCVECRDNSDCPAGPCSGGVCW